MSTKYNKCSKRSGFIDTNEDRPFWQKDRGERHGNNRRWKSKEKWSSRKLSRKREKRIWKDYESEY